MRYLGVCGDGAVVVFGDLGFCLAKVFAGRVEGGFGHCRGRWIVNWLLNGKVKSIDYGSECSLKSCLLGEILYSWKGWKLFEALTASEGRKLCV